MTANNITLTNPSLVLLVGCSGAGKSTLASRLFAPSEIVSLDALRAVVSGDHRDMSATEDAVAVAKEIVERRLRRRLLTVVDGTNLKSEDRRVWTEIAKRTHTLVSAIIVDPGERICHERLKLREGDHYRPRVVQEQHRLLKRDRFKLAKLDGIRNVATVDTEELANSVTLQRRPLWHDKRDETAGLDFIGDVHGCTDELEDLLASLGWTLEWSGEGEERKPTLSHPLGRKLVFVGDVTDRGPRPLDALLIMESAVKSGVGYAVASNHDVRVQRWLSDRDVTRTHGIDTTIADFEGKSGEFKSRLREFLDGLVGHLVFDGGKVAVAHAGLKEEMVLGASKEMREYCVFGEKGPPDEDGKTRRIDWAADYRGKTTVVYGHVACEDVDSINNAICIDTGCVYGNRLTAFRWPEKEFASVPARKAYVEADEPLFSRKDKRDPLLLDLTDVLGKRYVTTRLLPRVTVEADHAASALETMSRFAIDPRWLIHLPPTMSPVESSTLPGYLEHPNEAFEYYRREGLSSVVMETKHMGSRALLLVCRDEEVARRRFGTEDGHIGHVWSRNGRAFFKDVQRRVVLERLSNAADKGGLFDALGSDWVLLDAEIMPWNAKAADLIQHQFAPTGVAAKVSTDFALDALSRFSARGVENVSGLLSHYGARNANARAFDKVWRGYCWEAPEVDDIKIAPFHVLASEGRVHDGETHVQHMKWINKITGLDYDFKNFNSTPLYEIDLNNPHQIAWATTHWEEWTANGGEGVVIKPPVFTTRGAKHLVQPALKVRGKDYLRIIYGPDYDLPENLERLRERAIRSKRSLAIREFALGIEALDRFVKGEPLRRVHECVFALMALSADPTDPRL